MASLYQWDRWFKRKSFTLIRGADYTCQTHGMYRNVIQAAHKRGYKVSIKTGDERLVVKVVSRPGQSDGSMIAGEVVNG